MTIEVTAAGHRVSADAVLFDKDGTLIDLHGPWHAWAEATIHALCARSPELVPERLAAAIGVGEGRVEPDGVLAGGTDAMIGAALVDVLLDAGVRSPEGEVATAMEHAHDRVDVEALVAALPGVVDILRASADATGAVAVVTADTVARAWQHLAHIGVRDAVDVVIGADRVERGKPDPEPVLLACAELGVEPGRAVLFGDSEHDAVAAERAGVPHRVLVRPTAPAAHLQGVLWARTWAQVSAQAAEEPEPDTDPE